MIQVTFMGLERVPNVHRKKQILIHTKFLLQLFFNE